MGVTNRKDRKKAITRFIIVYLLALAIPVFIVLSSLTVKDVDKKDTADNLDQLGKRNKAFKEVYQLASRLDELQEQRSEKNYHEQRLRFESQRDALQAIYRTDTVTYDEIYKLSGILSSFHDRFEQSGKNRTETVDEYKRQVQSLRDSLRDAMISNKETSKEKTQEAEDLRRKLSNSGRDLNDIITSITEITNQAQGINRRDRDNPAIKRNILNEVNKIKNSVDRVKQVVSP